jgi:hypothetical protein
VKDLQVSDTLDSVGHLAGQDSLVVDDDALGGQE